MTKPTSDPLLLSIGDTKVGYAATLKAIDRVWARVRLEEWLPSDAVSQRLGCRTPEVGREYAARLRDDGQLFGVWSETERLHYHPPFQFQPNGQTHPRLAALLFALAQVPTLSTKDDSGGWGRLGWLIQRRGSLSEYSLAEDASPDGIALNGDSLSAEARTPEQVFPIDPDAVIALAHADADYVRGFT